MKAMVRDEYGSPGVLELTDIDMPVAKDDEVLVRVRAAQTGRSSMAGIVREPISRGVSVRTLTPIQPTGTAPR